MELLSCAHPVSACALTARFPNIFLSTENVKPSQGKQITPYLLNETFLAKSVSWNGIFTS